VEEEGTGFHLHLRRFHQRWRSWIVRSKSESRQIRCSINHLYHWSRWPIVSLLSNELRVSSKPSQRHTDFEAMNDSPNLTKSNHFNGRQYNKQIVLQDVVIAGAQTFVQELDVINSIPVANIRPRTQHNKFYSSTLLQLPP
jgi:hypothetical protein